MVTIFSWIKKEFVYIKDSFTEIIKALILFILASTGLVCAIVLRYLDYNWSVIMFFSIIVEFIALIICYFIFRGYLKTEEPIEQSLSLIHI